MTSRSPRKAAAKSIEPPPPPPPPGDLRRSALVLVALWALLFAPQLFGGRGFVSGDTSSIRAFAEFSGARWHEHHQRTHWNPYIFAGLPGSASLQDSRPQWLPDLLLDGFDGLHRLPGFPPLAIPLLVHLAGMIAMAALARRLWGAGTAAMVWSGAAWGLLPGQLVPLAFGQEWLVMSMSLMPVILLAIARCAAAETARERLASGLGLALATFGQFQSSHAQIIAFTLPLAAAFAIERSRPGKRIATLAMILGFAALGVVMAAAVWWPAQLYTAHSVRGGGAGISKGEVAAWSAGLPDLVALVWPWAAGYSTPTYWGGLSATDFPQCFGTAVFVLALFGLRRRDGEERAARLLAVTAMVAVLLSLGVHLGPFYELIQRIPVWSTFRTAIRTLIVAQLAFALLSARGFESLRAAAARDPRRWHAIAAGIAVAGLAFAALLHSGFLTDTYVAAVRAARPRIEGAVALDIAHRAALDLGARSLLVAALVLLFAVGTRASFRWRASAAIALLVLDLAVVSVPHLRSATGSLDAIAHPAAPLVAQLTAADPAARVLDVTLERMHSNDWIRWRAHSLTGNHSATPREWGETWGAANGSYPALCALAVRYFTGVLDAPPESALFRMVPGSTTSEPVWELRHALPRAYAVGSVVRLENEREVLDAFGALDFDPRAAAYTAEDGIAAAYPGSATCRIRWLADEPDHLDLEVTSLAPAFVVIADTWFPGWRATLDGRAVPIHRVQHLLRGFAVPAGSHRLRLDYVPEGWIAAVVWTRAAWLIWLAGALAAIGLSRPRPRAIFRAP